MRTRDNIYLVNVLASDGANTTSLDITVTVTDENETPSVSGETSISYEENRTDTVATYIASDPKGTSITWSLSVGDDSRHFSISNDGTLTFKTSPDYETPEDSDTNNVYLVEVRASNGPNTGTLDVTVTVTDENEPPAFAEETVTRTIPENGRRRARTSALRSQPQTRTLAKLADLHAGGDRCHAPSASSPDPASCRPRPPWTMRPSPATR